MTEFMTSLKKGKCCEAYYSYPRGSVLRCMYNIVHLFIIYKYILFDITAYIFIMKRINYGRFISVYLSQDGGYICIVYCNKYLVLVLNLACRLGLAGVLVTL